MMKGITKMKTIRRLTTQAARIQANFCDGIAFAEDTHTRSIRSRSPSTATRIVPLVALRAAAHAAHAVVKGLPRLELVSVQGGLDRGGSCHATAQEQTWSMGIRTYTEKHNDGSDEKY